MMKLQDFKYLITESFHEWSDDKASRLAASLAYYTVFSIPPLLIIILAISGQVFDDAQSRITAEITGFIGETGGEAIVAILENASKPGTTIVATVVSVITLFLGASGVFGQLQDALNTVWEVQADPHRGFLATIKARFFSFTMVLGVGFLLLVSLIVSAALAGLNEFISGLVPGAIILAGIINFVVSFSIITLLFALIYKVVPDVIIGWQDVWIGALVTAALFTLGKWGVGVYLSRSAPASTYGAAGSLIIILLWVYYSTQILFLGAEFTQVYANRYGSHLKPERGAVPLTEEARQQQGMTRMAENEQKAEPQSTGEVAELDVRPRTVLAPPPRGLQQSVNQVHRPMTRVLAVPTAVWQWVRLGRR
jgi:membrane protein